MSLAALAVIIIDNTPTLNDNVMLNSNPESTKKYYHFAKIP